MGGFPKPPAEQSRWSPAAGTHLADTAMGTAVQQAQARLMKWLPNETGHWIRIYIKEEKKKAQPKIRGLYTCISLSAADFKLH